MNHSAPKADPNHTKQSDRTWDALYRRRGIIQARPSPEVVGAIRMFRHARLETVLDLGCGTGRHTRLLADNGFSVYACDQSREALDMASRSVPEAQFQWTRMTELPYEDGFFDGVLCYQVLQHARMDGVLQAVTEVIRVLRSGGMLFLRVPSAEHPEAATGEETEPGTRLGIDAIDGDVPHHYFTRGELDRLFDGFNVLSLVHKHHASGKDPSRPAASWSLMASLHRP